MAKDKNDKKPENDENKAGAGPDAPPASDNPPPPDAPPAPAPKKPALVRMVRPGPKPPTTADVHPAEVANYAAGGWVIAKEIKA